ncbi:probable complex I intermediate-associated protein 30 isoform X3 [Malus sylvestris]|uniref:probable complex I intermediate-associated protein 30 isoform X3 n=1 Tax=Malus sylvestris TaxID=3752 RepID=UPI0007EDE92D|nr:probable complex I intermediate-associated protein 30 isoform X3 [Malus sylvestris]
MENGVASSWVLFNGKFVEREMSRFRGMLQASLNATKKALTWNVEDLVPPTERFIFNFNSKDELKKWHLYSDSEYGGLSSASLEVPDNENGPTGIFSGNLSLDFIEGAKLKINRSGFCGMRSKKFDGYIDLDPYDTIALKVKGDGRCYISTVTIFVYDQAMRGVGMQDSSCSVSTNMERKCYRCRNGNEPFARCWHVSISQCRRRSPRC